MRLEIHKAQLIEVLNKLITIISKANVVPILNNFLFEIQSDKVIIKATNSFMQVSYTIDMKSESPFKFCVDARLFFETIRLFSANDISIILKENHIIIRNGTSNYKIVNDDPVYYPAYDFVQSDNVMRVTSEALLTGLSKTMWIVDENNKVPVMAGVCIKNDIKKLNIVGCQNTCIANYDIDLPESFNFTDCVIPKETAMGIKNVLVDKDCTICISEKKIHVKSLYCEIVGVLIDYKYPDTRRFFKSKPEKCIRIKRQELLSDMGRLRLYAKSDTSAVTLTIKDGQMVLTASDLFNNNLGYEVITGINASFDIQIHLNLEHLYNVVFNVDGEEVDVFFTEPSKPFFVSSIPLEGQAEMEFVLMPIQL